MFALACVGLGAWWLSRSDPPDSQLARPQGERLPQHPQSPVTATWHVKVTVVDDTDSTPLAAAQVLVVKGPSAPASADDALSEWTTDATGVIEFDVPASTDALGLMAGGEGHLWSALTPLSKAMSFTLRCPRGTAIEGTVVDQQGTALAGVRVTAASQARGAAPTLCVGLTNQGGHFTVWASPGLNWLRAGGDLWSYDERPVTAPVDSLRLVLTPASGLRGRVQRADGSPAPHARILLSGTEVGQADEAGLFEFEGLLESMLSLEARDEPSHQASQRVVVHLEPRVWVDVVLRLEPFHSLAGVVIDPDGRPLPGASVNAQPATARAPPSVNLSDAQTLSDSQGRFSVPTNQVDPNAWVDLTAWAGHQRGVLRAHLADHAVLAVTQRSAVIGAMVWPTGAPVPTFRVTSLLRGGRDSFERTIVNDAGRFELFREDLGDELSLDVDRQPPVHFTLPDAGVDLGTIVYQPLHRVTLEVFFEGARVDDFVVDRQKPHLDDAGATYFETLSGFRSLVMHDAFAPKELLIGSESYRRVDLERGGALVIHTEPVVRAAQLFVELTNCEPEFLNGLDEEFLKHLPRAHCTVNVQTPDDLEGHVEVDLPGVSITETTIRLQPRPPRTKSVPPPAAGTPPPPASADLVDLPQPRHPKRPKSH